jgi:predicted SnoaL-like aldol condensation-catalyzing enzyme
MIVGNGFVGPFPGEPEDPTVLQLEDRNIGTIRRYYARIWSGDGDAIADLVDDDYRSHRDGKIQTGRTALIDQIRRALTHYPDLNVVIRDVVGAGEYVAVHLDISYTKPDSVQVDLRALTIYHLQNGQIVESWSSYSGPAPPSEFPLSGTAGYQAQTEQRAARPRPSRRR